VACCRFGGHWDERVSMMQLWPDYLDTLRSLPAKTIATNTNGLMNRLVVILSEAKNPPHFGEILRFAQD